MRRRRIVAFVAALGLLATACAGGGGDSNEGGQTTGGGSATANDINPVERDALPDGGTLRWSITGMPANYNSGELDGTNIDTSSVMGALLPAMFDFDAKAEPTVNRDYLESAEVTGTDPKQVVTYKINPKAAWDDGTPITWADFEAQWKARNGTNPAYRISSSNGYEHIESVVRGVDDREAIVTYKQRFVDWKGLFSYLYPASTNNDPAIFNDGWKEKPLATAGPFRLESIDLTGQSITLVRNDKWWGERAKLDRIVYRVIAADAEIDALVNNEIDFMDIGPDVNKFQRASQASGVTIRKAGGPNFRHITINGASEVLKDVKVRKALALAINREQIAKILLGPLGVETTPLQNHIFMANQTGYKDNAGELSTHNVEEAKRLLDEAGWKVQGDIRKKDGKDLVIRFVIPSAVASSLQESNLVMAMLKEVNARVDIVTVPAADFFDKHITPGNYDLTVFSWLGTALPISSAKSIYAQPTPRPDGTLELRQNYARTGSPEIDALFDQASTEIDQQKAIDLANQADALIWQLVHSLTLYQRPELIAVRGGLANFGAFGFASTRYEDIGFAK
ncbi:MAG TPA: ABC transporter family substrate-binding protein [Acidimicrobiia bacterium]|nr:ABC transporter family substrate-binding protein [Acidimicrobiia bacterium]